MIRPNEVRYGKFLKGVGFVAPEEEPSVWVILNKLRGIPHGMHLGIALKDNWFLAYGFWGLWKDTSLSESEPPVEVLRLGEILG